MSPRYEVIMKSDTDYRIYDNEKRSWVYTGMPGKTTNTFATRELAFIVLDLIQKKA